MLDDVTSISREYGLAHDTRKRLRTVFMKVNHSKDATWNSLLKDVSPQLRRDISHELNHAWVRKIHFLSTCTVNFVTDVTQLMIRITVLSEEFFGVISHLYINGPHVHSNEDFGVEAVLERSRR